MFSYIFFGVEKPSAPPPHKYATENVCYNSEMSKLCEIIIVFLLLEGPLRNQRPVA
jgi:hypothetical protein